MLFEARRFTGADVLEILAPHLHSKAETARPLRWCIRAVLEWAVAMEFRVETHATGSVRSWVPCMTSCRACGRCPIVRWPWPSVRLAFEFLDW